MPNLDGTDRTFIMASPIRNRIKGHRRVRAGELIPHELNFRLHPEAQQAALRDLYQEVGFARSLLAYELPDGRLKLIDGHLRRDLDPNLEVDVEILDVNDAEARTLLLSMDPLAALAQTHTEIHDRLRALTQTDSEALNALWQGAADAAAKTEELLHAEPVDPGPEQFLILVTCRDDEQQRALLQQFTEQGLACRAVQS
jgi:hypothetical protein